MVAKSCPVVEVRTSTAMECMDLLIDKGQRGFGCTGKPSKGHLSGSKMFGWRLF